MKQSYHTEKLSHQSDETKTPATNIEPYIEATWANLEGEGTGGQDIPPLESHKWL